MSDLEGEFFVSLDCQQAPGLDRRFEAYCKRYRKFRPKFHGPAQGLVHGLEFIANENAVFFLPAYAIDHSPPGVVRGGHQGTVVTIPLKFSFVLGVIISGDSGAWEKSKQSNMLFAFASRDVSDGRWNRVSISLSGEVKSYCV